MINNKYWFPSNYKYSAKLMGLIEYKVLVPIAIFISIIIGILYLLKVDFFVGFGIVLMLSIPSILILSVGINGQPAIPYIKAIIKFSKKKKLYIYK